MIDPRHRPLFVVVGTNLMDRGPFEAAAAAAGYRVDFVAGDALPAAHPLVVFVDLETKGADEAIVDFADRGVRVVAYGPHVDDEGMMRARALGASAAEPRSRLITNPGAYLSPLV